MNSFDIRNSFLRFFESKKHEIIKSSNLITNDKTLLFVNAGMVPLKKYFLNEDIPQSKRMTSSQKCLRVSGKHNDLDQVGFTKRHHTFFEMLGNFSFGDYFKQEVIEYAWEFLTKVLQLNKERLYITVYKDDSEAFDFWKKLTNFHDSKIIKIGTSDNFWSMGDTGPCGPCSEIFYDHGDKYPGDIPGSGNEQDRFIEIWNLVFMQKNKTESGLFDLAKKCIDTGMGLERITAVMQGTPDNYETDLFSDLIHFTYDLFKNGKRNDPSYRVISDHIRSSVFLISEGLLPSNEGRGYVLRRIIRRAMNYVFKVNPNGELNKVADFFIDNFSKAYPELMQNKPFIIETIKNEELAFKDSFFRGIKILNSEIEKNKNISAEFAFKLYDTYGFPLDITINIATSNGKTVDIDGFDRLMSIQKESSKQGLKMLESDEDIEKLALNIKSKMTSSGRKTTPLCYEKSEVSEVKPLILYTNDESVPLIREGCKGIVVFGKTPFYAESGGQIADTGIIKSNNCICNVVNVKKYDHIYMHFIEVKKGILKLNDLCTLTIDSIRRKQTAANHTATHLLHAALRKLLGNFISQHGSFVANDRLRFDFNFSRALTKEEIYAVEMEVNTNILKAISVTTEIISLEEAKKSGATALFGEKYDSIVRVVSITEGANVVSKELCGGTHVKNTSEISLFKIISETSVGVGIRRIEAITSLSILNYINNLDALISNIENFLLVKSDNILNKIKTIQEENTSLKQKNQSLLINQAIANSKVVNINAIKLVTCTVNNFENNTLKVLSDNLKSVYNNSIFILVNKTGNSKLSILVAVHDSISQKYDARFILNKISDILGIKTGGGKNILAQTGVSLNLLKQEKKFEIFDDNFNLNLEKVKDKIFI